jgi:hypothetical protein
MNATYSSAFAGALVLSIVARGALQAQADCTEPTSPAVIEILKDSLAAATTAKPGRTEDVETASAQLRMAGECAVAVTMSWNDRFDGGVIIFTPSRAGVRLLAAAAYPGAKNPIPAGSGRVAFSYSASRGSGQLAERTVVLCALATDNWVPCADILTHQEVAASGYLPTDSLARGVRLAMKSKVSVHGDTLVITTEVLVKRYGRAPETRKTLVSRHVLP